MNVDFSGKRALVTGAGKGIGRGTAKALAERGATVIAISRTKDELESLKSECRDGSIVPVVLDLSKVEESLTALKEHLPIHLLVNNVAGGAGEPFLETKIASFENAVIMNMKLPLFLSQMVAQDLISRKEHGNIVHVSTISALKPMFACTIYGGTKCALDYFSKNMALELGKDGIRVNVVSPGFVENQLTKPRNQDKLEEIKHVMDGAPLPRMIKIDEVVQSILFLLSDYSAMTTGEFITVDGGMMLM